MMIPITLTATINLGKNDGLSFAFLANIYRKTSSPNSFSISLNYFFNLPKFY